MSLRLEVRDVDVQFKGLKALSGVTLGVADGEVLGLIGPNGAGKSTLINVLTGALRPTRGEVCIDGRPVRRWSLTAASRSGVARTFQTTRVFEDWTVRRNVDVAARSSRSGTDPAELLAVAGLVGLEQERAGDLSHGDVRKLGIAVALATGPRTVLLDEPTVGMTAPEVDDVRRVIADLRGLGISIIVVDHNMAFVMGVTDRIEVLDGGTQIAHGTPEQIRNDPLVIEAYLGASADA
jgi:ABC-type branched-subunit amino acid transport system ATPase component